MAYLPVLFRIQEVHNRRKTLRKICTEAEQSSELIELRKRKSDYHKKLAAIQKRQELIRKNQQQLDLDLKSCLDKIRQDEIKLYGGAVVNSRELEQIQLKIGEYTNTKSQIEESSYLFLEEDEKLTTLKAQIEKAVQANDQKLMLLEGEIEQKIGELNLELAALEFELNELTPQAPKEWLERLEKIARSHNDIGIAQIKSGCCGACHVSLPESLLQKAKRGEDQILLCENCGRIIFY